VDSTASSVLSEIDRLVRGIASLRKIIVYTGWKPDLSPELEEFLQSLGWVIVTRDYLWPED
jgi:hypothetical protein